MCVIHRLANAPVSTPTPAVHATRFVCGLTGLHTHTHTHTHLPHTHTHLPHTHTHIHTQTHTHISHTRTRTHTYTRKHTLPASPPSPPPTLWSRSAPLGTFSWQERKPACACRATRSALQNSAAQARARRSPRAMGAVAMRRRTACACRPVSMASMRMKTTTVSCVTRSASTHAAGHLPALQTATASAVILWRTAPVCCSAQQTRLLTRSASVNSAIRNAWVAPAHWPNR